MAIEKFYNDDGTPASLETFLTAKSPVMRVVGRGIASGWTKTAIEWMQAEVDRGTEGPVVLEALSHLYIETAAAIAAACFSVRADQHVLQNLMRHLERKFPAAVAHTRALNHTAGDAS